MNFGKLLSEGKIKKIKKAFLDFESCEDDLNSSKHSFASKDYEWAATIAYNAVLRAGIKLMAFLGYRAVGKEHHKNVFEFLKETGIEPDLINYFNKIRIRRNEFLYRDISATSKEESEEIIEKAKELVNKIRTFVQEKGTLQKNDYEEDDKEKEAKIEDEK